MSIAIWIVVVIVILSLIGTMVVAGKSDENYHAASKRNTFRLTFIYVIVILLSLIALAWYIKVF